MNQDQCSAQHEHLLHLFTTEYEKYVSHMDTDTQNRLRQIAPMVFSKWYYTTLASDTILSPINIISLDFDTEKKEKIYTLRTKVNENKELQYEFSLLTYSMLHHPIIEDIHIILDHCVPDCAVDKNGQFFPDSKKKLLEHLSLYDEFYLEYLVTLCHQMGFFHTIPSIHVHKIQKNETADSFFSLSLEKQLRILLDEACYLAAQRFQHIMDLDAGVLDDGFFHDFLTSPQSVDDIFTAFYKRLQIEVHALWETPPEDMTGEDKALLSSLLFAGIVLDKWFLTPMSTFLRVIRPISFIPMDFYRVVNNLSGIILMKHNLSAELFSPASYYSLTAIGKAICDVDTEAENRQAMPSTLTFEQILQVILPEIESALYEELHRLENDITVLQLFVVMEKNKEIWKIVETNKDVSIHTFCHDLCISFDIENIPDYVLSVPDQNGFPVEYSPIGSKKSINKTNHLSLAELPLSTEKSARLIPNGDPRDTLIITVREEKKGDPYLSYPRICEQSERVTEREQIDEIF